MMKRYVIILLAIVAGILAATDLKADNVKLNAGTYETYEGSLPKGYKQLNIASDGTAMLTSSSDSISALWTLRDNRLKLMLCPGVNFYKPDSVMLAENDSISALLVYKNNKLSIPQALNLNGKDFIQAHYTYHVSSSGKDSLLLESANHEFSMHKTYDSGASEILKNQGISLMGILRGLLGLAFLIFIAWIFSTDRKAISWRVVGIGLGIQALLAISILKIPFVKTFFEFIGQIFVKILSYSQDGAEFLLGGLMDSETYGYIFAFQILPTIIFFSALTSVLFYLGVIQKIVYGLAWLLTKALRISGAESLSVAGNIFLGQTESPLMIKAYLPGMNKSEILLVMIGGMATVAGGVLAAYIGFLGGDDPAMRLLFAKHLLAASVMAAPGAIVVSKILAPQTKDVSGKVEVSKDKVGSNILDALSNGTTEGLKLAVNVAAMLLVFVAVIALLNGIFGWVGGLTNLNGVIAEATGGEYTRLSLQFLLGYTFAPLMWMIGVSGPDIDLVGRLLGEKLIMSEFIGYISLAELKDAAAFAEEKSIIMATYMLCGFANFASIGIQIGGIGSLAPNQRKQLSIFGMRALLGGMLASLLSATMVGMILG
ncbi:MAG TPA: nucleoside transporter C-terminal domain-containing protein [Bacteroidales bacterium]|nr:nucleoside transporter C-terminal domain-containing protein [Bacteroidales bacterium]